MERLDHMLPFATWLHLLASHDVQFMGFGH